jgi:hypothetical protein
MLKIRYWLLRGAEGVFFLLSIVCLFVIIGAALLWILANIACFFTDKFVIMDGFFGWAAASVFLSFATGCASFFLKKGFESSADIIGSELATKRKEKPELNETQQKGIYTA